MFTDAQVIEMRTSPESAEYFAKLHGCETSTVYRIRRGHAYKTVAFARPVSRAYDRKFTDLEVKEIRASDDSNEQCAKRHKVSPRTIWSIRQGLSYKHLPVDPLYSERAAARKRMGRPACPHCAVQA